MDSDSVFSGCGTQFEYCTKIACSNNFVWN